MAAQGGLMELESYSLLQCSDTAKSSQLQLALDWINAAFQGDPYDVRSWDVLVPLAPHRQVAQSTGSCSIYPGGL